MKPARERDAAVLEQDGVVFGVLLAGDFTAEHEWGIDSMRHYLGLSTKPFGFAGRCIAEPYPHFGFKTGQFSNDVYEENKEGGLGKRVKLKCKTATLTLHENDIDNDRTTRYMAESQFVGAWSDRAFSIVGFDKAGIAIVELLKEGLETGDFAVWLGGSNMNPFSRSGLVLVRPSLVPQEYKDHMDRADQDAKLLREAGEKTGIHKRLEKAGCRYFACRASWNERDNGNKMRDDTKYNVVFWLNPMDQNDNNYGWFTVEELDQWTKGKGPIPKKAA